MNKKTRQLASKFLGPELTKLIDILKEQEYTSEYIIAEKINKDINQTRGLLYQLSQVNLVTTEKQKDKIKGWYIYYWKFLDDNLLSYMFKSLKKEEEKYNNRIKEEQENTFFVCPNNCVRLTFDEALNYNFKCPECGEILKEDNDKELIKKLEKRKEEVNKEIREIREEIEKSERRREKEKKGIIKEEENAKRKEINNKKPKKEKTSEKKRKVRKRTVKKTTKNKTGKKRKTTEKKKISRKKKTTKKKNSERRKKSKKKAVKKKAVKKKTTKKKTVKKKTTKKKKSQTKQKRKNNKKKKSKGIFHRIIRRIKGL